MFALEEITIEKKELIDSFLKRKCSQNSEFTFTNLFMWRKSYDIRYAVINDMLCIMPRHADGPRSATFPIGFVHADGSEGDIVPVIEKLLAYFEQTGEEPLIRLYDDTTVERLTKAFPNRFLITEDINSFDYVYSVEELTNLAGKRFHGKKNHVNKFQRLYNWEYRPIVLENVQNCIDVFEQWYQNKVGEIPGIEEEHEAVLELFSHWQKLDVRGGSLWVDDKMIAFSVGEPLCGKMAVVHLEHADTAYEGAFAMMNQQFLKHEWQDFIYVNREEDMGIPGMRQAKESYRPVFMVKKYVATLQK